MLGEKLLDLRKSKGLSQEEVADKLGVTRQTVSKWETDQSTPDFDKIAPLCELYEISADELLTGVITEKKEEVTINNTDSRKRTFGICIGIFLYFVAVAWIMTSIPVLMINPVLASAIFILIIGVATITIVYHCVIYKKDKKLCKNCCDEESTVEKQVIHITSILFTIIYLYISFATGKWAITWIIWIVYALVESIIKLLFSLRGEKK
jgi:transcriptional regulator with XRE-family HTH domain